MEVTKSSEFLDSVHVRQVAFWKLAAKVLVKYVGKRSSDLFWISIVNEVVVQI